MTSPLRILHTESSTGWGGQEIRILSEMRGILDRGHELMLLTPESAEIYPAAQRLRIPVVAVPMLKKRLPPLLALRRWLEQHGRGFSVINSHSSTDSWLAAAACATLRRQPPIVRTRHVSTAINNHATTRWLYRQATAHIVTTGEALRQQLHRDNGIPLSRTTSVRTGIDLKRYRPLPQAQCRTALGVAARPTLGILATLRDWKGHDDLLDAWATLRADFADWQLLIIGDGPRRAHLEQRVAQMHLADSVQLVGNQDNVPEWLNCLDLFVLPSFGDEGVPQGIMQAMACGKAVVSTPVGAIGEALQADKTGLMVEPRNPKALAAALARLMGDAALREHFGSAGLAYAQSHFGLDIMLDRMEAVFRQVIAERGQGNVR
jgi:glycosyltransferase involved in cell wall biosynthesis